VAHQSRGPYVIKWFSNCDKVTEIELSSLVEAFHQYYKSAARRPENKVLTFFVKVSIAVQFAQRSFSLERGMTVYDT